MYDYKFPWIRQNTIHFETILFTKVAILTSLGQFTTKQIRIYWKWSISFTASRQKSGCVLILSAQNAFWYTFGIGMFHKSRNDEVIACGRISSLALLRCAINVKERKNRYDGNVDQTTNNKQICRNFEQYWCIRDRLIGYSCVRTCTGILFLISVDACGIFVLKCSCSL